MSKILLIDDDELMIRLFTRVFTLDGFSVESANDGLEGYQKAKVSHPDLILLDIMMPNLNGLQTLEKLKNDPDTKDFPVIMLTNLANKSDAELATTQTGAALYLVKSEYQPHEILEIVKEFLKNHQAAQVN